MKEITHNKLVRDNIIDIIVANGDKPVWRYLDIDEYWDYLIKKDSEELNEVKEATSPLEVLKELGDKLELIKAMALFHGFSLEDVIEEANRKKAKNGGFEKRILLEKVFQE